MRNALEILRRCGADTPLARHLVELHDGSIEARSEGIGKGSEFIVRVPRTHAVAADSPERATA